MTLEEISEGAAWFRFLGPDGQVTHEERCRYRFTAWSTLYSSLVRHFPSQQYLFGREVVGIDAQADHYTVTTSAGEVFAGDLVIGADGITSTTRRLLLPEVSYAYSGYLGWRGVVRESELDPAAFNRLYEAITYFTPRLSHILAYPIPDFGRASARERTLNYVWYRNLEAGPELDDVMTDITGELRGLSVAPGHLQARHIANLRGEAESVLPEDLAQMVLATEHPFIQSVVDVEVPKMAFGRMCLIGDAAFAARPHAAAGTAKAAADGWDLAAALDHGSDPVEALQSWEPRALARGSRLVARARQLGTMAQVQGTFQFDDPEILFGLEQPGDSCYP
jgi:2,6-dihydroxypyridine 3-monooxygenase